MREFFISQRDWIVPTTIGFGMSSFIQLYPMVVGLSL